MCSTDYVRLKTPLSIQTNRDNTLKDSVKRRIYYNDNGKLKEIKEGVPIPSPYVPPEYYNKTTFKERPAGDKDNEFKIQ